MKQNVLVNKFNVHFLLPAFISICSIVVALLEVYDFRPNINDFSLFGNLLWNFAHGNGWLMTPYTGQVREFFLADHLALLTPLFSLPFIVAPSPYTLSLMHGLAFSTIFFLAPVYVREVFRHEGHDGYLAPAFFLLLALWLFPGIGGAWRFQTHMTTLAMPFLLLALIFLHKDKVWPAIVCCILLALAQERASVAVFGVGMYAFLILKKHRLGLGLCAFSAIYFWLAVRVIIPWCAGGANYMYSHMIKPEADIDQKLVFIGKCLMGWFFLGIWGKKAVFATVTALPLLMIGLISSRSEMYHFSIHYQDLPSLLLFTGATFGLSRFLKFASDKKAVLASGFVVVICSVTIMDTDFFQRNSLYRLVKRVPNEAIINANKILEPYKNLPGDIKAFSTSALVPRLAMRKHCQHIYHAITTQPLTKTMFFIAPKLSIHHYTQEQVKEMLSNLQANPSLKMVHESEDMYIFASKDISLPKLDE